MNQIVVTVLYYWSIIRVDETISASCQVGACYVIAHNPGPHNLVLPSLTLSFPLLTTPTVIRDVRLGSLLINSERT